MTLVHNQLGGTHPRANAGISSILAKNNVVRLTLSVSADRLETFPIMAAWPKNSNAGESTDNTTHIKSRTDKNGNLQTYETQIAVIPNIFTIARCGDHIAAPQSKSQLFSTHPHHPMENVQYTCAITRVVSLPPKLSRIAKTVGNHGGPAK